VGEYGGNQLKHFNLTKNLEFTCEEDFIKNHATKWQYHLYLFYRKLRKPFFVSYKLLQCFEKLLAPSLNKNGIYLQWIGYVKHKDYNKKNIFIEGVYECSKYFLEIAGVIREEFIPIYYPLSENVLLYHIINTRESVCVSVRRGDFVSRPNLMKQRYICRKKYFERAIKTMKEKNPQCIFIFFQMISNGVKGHSNPTQTIITLNQVLTPYGKS
jgi:hypothetical protein